MAVGVSLSAVGESVDGSHLSLPPYYAVNHTEAVGITLLTLGESGDGSFIPLAVSYSCGVNSTCAVWIPQSYL